MRRPITEAATPIRRSCTRFPNCNTRFCALGRRGNFVEDWRQAPVAAPAITPEGLDRAALENMSGGAFYPGMEASWLFAKKDAWAGPFRLARNRRVGTIPVPSESRRDVIVEAGAFTQQMALPWQADFVACAKDMVDDPAAAGGQRQVAWWPATRPDDVFPFDRPKERWPWARVPDPQAPLGYREMQSARDMVERWSTLGFIVETTPDGAAKDLYEVEFNKGPVLVGCRGPRVGGGLKKGGKDEKEKAGKDEKEKTGTVTSLTVVRRHIRDTDGDAMSQYDITIAGAGPAGSVLALLAARAHYRVLLVEKSRFDKPRIGETAPPELRPLLSKLQLDYVLNKVSYVEAPALVSVWGSDEPLERNHILSPYGNALHLDRRRFDEGLTLAAQAAGADLRLGVSLRFEPRRANGYLVILSDGTSARAEVAVRANGRMGDDVAAVARFAATPRRLEPRTVIEAIAGGWFYLAAIPGGELVTVFVTRAAMVPSDRTTRLRWWLEALARTRLVRAELTGQPIPQSLSIYNARSSFLRTNAATDWFAVGDARMAPDPLSGQGIIWAIEDAVFAAQALRSDINIAEAMALRMPDEVANYLAMRDRIYGMERRFPNDAYWSP
jgi:2-polyprenyl-6-methoxyphenol hydroxylase-like FAD-dependent oxidoreductase